MLLCFASRHTAAALTMVVGVLAASCSAALPQFPTDGGGTGDMSNNGEFCSPGATESCFCPNGTQGIATCRATGQSYGPCIDCGDAGNTLTSDMAVSMGNPCGNCDGCCLGSTCVLISGAESTTQCGPKGSSCAPCATGDTCTSGQCVNGSTMTCTNCPNPGTVCQNGSCSSTIDPNAMFTMTIKEIKFTPEDDGSEWDEFGGAPDPFVCVQFTYNGTVYNGCNVYCSDTYDCIPPSGSDYIGNSNGSSTPTAPVYIPGSVIIGGQMTITAWDDDEVSNDLAGTLAPFPATSTYMTSYSTGAFNNVIQVTFTLN